MHPALTHAISVRLGGRVAARCAALHPVVVHAALWTMTLLPAAAGASVGALYGVSAASIGRAGQSAATPEGDATTFHNVAALASTDGSVRLGFVTALHAIALDARCSGPTCIAARRPAPTQSLSAGWAGKVHRRVGLGVTFSTPAGELVRISAPDPRRPHLPTLEGPADQFALFAGLGARVLPWLELGVGAQVRARIASAVQLDLDPINRTVDRADVQIHLGPTFSAVAGLRIHGPSATMVAVSWHQRAGVPYDIPAQLGLDGVGAVHLRLAQVAHTTPHTLQFAVAWRGPTIELEAGLRWALWARLQGLGPDLSSDVRGGLIDGVGLGRVADIDAPASAWVPTLRDTVSPGVSVRWTARPSLILRGGWRFRPSPFPPATATAAMLDSDAHVVAGGLSLHIAAWELGVGGQVLLWRRRATRSGPIAEHGGTTVVGSADLSRHF